MRKPALFVSSTCINLAQTRADLKRIIEHDLGYEAILSEYNFPTDPQLNTIDNCTNVVLEHADIFILIIGERYGYIPNDKSITHLEYSYAKAKGIPIYVFVKKEILSYLKLWKSNPDNKIFESVVDSCKLFDFLNEIMSEGTWVHSFEHSEEISNILKEQLAILFLKGLQLNYNTAHSQIKYYTGMPLKIVIEKPRAWEIKLFAEVLNAELAKMSVVKRNYKNRIALGKIYELEKPSDVFAWTITKNAQLSRYVDTITKLVRVIFPKALGDPGCAGDDEYINYTALIFSEVYRELMQWSLDHELILVPDELINLVQFNAELSSTLIEDLDEFFLRINRGKNEVDTLPDNSQIEFALNLRPPNIEGFYDRMNDFRELYGLEPIFMD